MMSAGLLLFVGNIYLLVAIQYYVHGRNGMCLAFLAYALANVGFAWDAWR
jgi:hypothetical protein